MIKKYFVDISIKNSEKSLKFTVTIKKKPEMDDEFINQLIKFRNLDILSIATSAAIPATKTIAA